MVKITLPLAWPSPFAVRRRKLERIRSGTRACLLRLRVSFACTSREKKGSSYLSVNRMWLDWVQRCACICMATRACELWSRAHKLARSWFVWYSLVGTQPLREILSVPAHLRPFQAIRIRNDLARYIAALRTSQRLENFLLEYGFSPYCKVPVQTLQSMDIILIKKRCFIILFFST